jgi:hypothetical protein
VRYPHRPARHHGWHHSNIGACGISHGTLAALANYALTYTGANLTVTAALLTVTADAVAQLW